MIEQLTEVMNGRRGGGLRNISKLTIRIVDDQFIEWHNKCISEGKGIYLVRISRKSTSSL